MKTTYDELGFDESLQKSIPNTCLIDFIESNQQVIINGEVTVNSYKIPQVKCPRCESVIAQFQPETDIGAIYTLITEELEHKINYCPKCGQRLAYFKTMK